MSNLETPSVSFTTEEHQLEAVHFLHFLAEAASGMERSGWYPEADSMRRWMKELKMESSPFDQLPSSPGRASLQVPGRRPKW